MSVDQSGRHMVGPARERTDVQVLASSERAPGPTVRSGQPSPATVVQHPRRLDLRLLLPVLVAWAVTAFVGLLVSTALVAAGSALLLSTAALLLRRRGSRRRASRRLICLTLTATAMCGLAAAAHRAVHAAGPLEDLAQESAVVDLRGIVASEPRVMTGVPQGDARLPQRRILVRVDVVEVRGRGGTSRVAAPVLVRADARWEHIRWRSEIRFSGRLEAAQVGDDVVAVVRARGPADVVSGPDLVFRVADTVRARFRDATAALPADARGLVPALVIGDTSRTPADLTGAMLDTGMSHLSAVSGSNVTLVLGAALGLCRLLLVPRRVRPPVALLVLAGFVVLARPEPSVIRAAVMGAVGLLGLSVDRRRAGVPALAAAMLGLLVWDPWLARSYGFALSSLATLGLLVLAHPWGAAIAKRLPARLAPVGPLVAVPLAAQAVCAPVVVPLQGSVSLIAVPANLLAEPLVGPTTMAGVTVALLSVVWTPLASVLAWSAAVPALGIAWVARLCAEVPGGSVGWGDSAGAAVLLAVVTVVVIGVAPWAWRGAVGRPLLAAAAVAVVAAFAVPTSTVGWPPPGWLVVACDVGQGDGLVIATGPGHAVVVDAGPDPGVMDACLHRLGVDIVDLVVLTHFHADHVDGLAGVLDGRRVGQIRVSQVREPKEEALRVDRLAAQAGVPVGELRNGDLLTDGDVRAEVWWPGRSIQAGSVPNNGSIVLTVHVKGVTILFSGDIEREAAADVISEARRDPARWGVIDVLKVAHHGSSNRDDRLFDLVRGRIALISVGVDNDYGHPAPSTLTALQRRGFQIHRTDLEGDIALVRTPAGLRTVGRG